MYGENVEQAGEDHHHEEWHVHDVPEGKQSLEGIEAGHLPNLAEVFLQIAADRCFQTIRMLAHNCGARRLVHDFLACQRYQTPVAAPRPPHDIGVTDDAADNTGRWREYAPVDFRELLTNRLHQRTHMAAGF